MDFAQGFVLLQRKSNLAECGGTCFPIKLKRISTSREDKVIFNADNEKNEQERLDALLSEVKKSDWDAAVGEMSRARKAVF